MSGWSEAAYLPDLLSERSNSASVTVVDPLPRSYTRHRHRSRQHRLVIAVQGAPENRTTVMAQRYRLEQ